MDLENIGFAKCRNGCGILYGQNHRVDIGENVPGGVAYPPARVHSCLGACELTHVELHSFDFRGGDRSLRNSSRPIAVRSGASCAFSSWIACSASDTTPATIASGIPRAALAN